VKDIGAPDDYTAVSHDPRKRRNDCSVYLSNVQTRYLQLRESLAFLTGIFLLFKQYHLMEDVLNDLSWGKGKRAAALRQRIVSNSHHLLLGDIAPDEEDGFVRVACPIWARKSPSGRLTRFENRRFTLRRRSRSRGASLDEGALHLMAYEAYFDGIEGELRDLIRSAQRVLYDVESDGWEEFREFLAQGDDDFLRLIEALPDYDALEIDEDAYSNEEDKLLGDGD